MRKSFVLLLLWLLALSSLPLLAQTGSPNRGGPGAEIPETKWVNIIGVRRADRFETKIEPFNKISVRRGTTVTWVNKANVDVRIQFGQGTECKALSRVALRVFAWETLKGCLVTQQPIPTGGLVETRFNEPGSFNYEVEYLGEKRREVGSVAVF